MDGLGTSGETNNYMDGMGKRERDAILTTRN